MTDGLESIEKCVLLGNLKPGVYNMALCLESWDVAITYVAAMEHQLDKYMKRWLGVPNSMTNAALHISHTKVTLPVKSLVKEFKGKSQILHDPRDSKDPVVKNTQSYVKNGRCGQLRKQ